MTTIASNPLTSAKRVFNFSAGPATLPEEVIRQAQQDLWSIFGTGIGILEHSHRGKAFDRVLEEAEADCRAVGNVSDDYEVIFVQGGATMQFAMIPMNFLPAGRTADYLDTGVWATKSVKEGRILGDIHVAFDGNSCNFDHCPSDDKIDQSPDAAYLHYCTNNTIYGTHFDAPPTTAAPLVADMSSEMYSRPWPLDKHAMIYAGAQKNLGPSGVVLVLVRKDFLATGASGLPSMLDYKMLAAKGSRLNTPPTFGIYMMGQVFKWIQRSGGIEAMAASNADKAAVLYDAIDGSGGFYIGLAQPQCRSLMNVAFKTPSPELDATFISEALEQDMSGLKGHRSTGGLRASIYNAFPKAGCEALASFMADFATRHG